MDRKNREEIVPRTQDQRLNHYILLELIGINDKLEKLLGESEERTITELPKEEIKPKRARKKKEVIK